MFTQVDIGKTTMPKQASKPVFPKLLSYTVCHCCTPVHYSMVTYQFS